MDLSKIVSKHTGYIFNKTNNYNSQPGFGLFLFSHNTKIPCFLLPNFCIFQSASLTIQTEVLFIDYKNKYMHHCLHMLTINISLPKKTWLSLWPAYFQELCSSTCTRFPWLLSLLCIYVLMVHFSASKSFPFIFYSCTRIILKTAVSIQQQNAKPRRGSWP